MSAQRPTPSTSAKPWYLRRTGAILSGLVLIVLCVALRFGWNGVEGPPFPFWGIAYLAGVGGIFLFYVGVTTPRQR